MKNLDFYVGLLSEVIVSIDNPGNPEIQHVTDDSRLVQPGDIFVAIPGVKLDGSKYVENAIKQGACCIVYQSGVELELPKNICGLEVANSRLALAWLQKGCFDFPDEKLTMFAVTGTNGKTTSAYILRAILEQISLPCGLISTVETICGARHAVSECTTPDAKHLYGLLDDFVQAGMKCCAMEVSSHSLTQYRTGGIKFKSAIFTNLTGDHLDYHHDMEQYFSAKQRLFLEQLEPGSTAAINIDDAYGARLAEILRSKKRCQVAAFGSALGADYRIIDMKISAGSSQFTIKHQNKCHTFTSNLIGRHNIYNLAGVMVALTSSKVATLEQLSNISGTLDIKVPGRLEKVALKNGGTAFIDYAHTDDALRNVLNILRTVTSRELTVVFGCGGDRDHTKRPRMGLVAAELADHLVLTSDNPRSENPGDIIQEIESGIPDKIDFQVEADRAKAIELALKSAAAGDVILIAGKGHENYQEINGIRHHFNDLELVQQLNQ